MWTTLLVTLLETAAAPRQPLVAYWVSHHDERPALEPWSQRGENPTLVVYDDGLAVFVRDGTERAVTLSESERKALLAPVEVAFTTANLGDSYTGTNRMHPPVHVVTRWKDGVRKSVRFFGALPDAAEREKAPPALLTALDALAGFVRPKAALWSPEEIVVRACRTTAEPDKRPWPAEWPKPDQGRPVSYLDGCFEHTLPAAQRSSAEGLVAKKKAMAVVAHGGARWLVTLTRFAMPAEAAWAGR